MGTEKPLSGFQLETSKKGFQANLGWSKAGLPKVQFACIEPFLDLSRDGRLREAVVVECDHVNLGATSGAPDRNCFCAPNDQQRLSLNGDEGCSRRHGLLLFVNFG